MPKVSVIIPVYNVEKYLRQCMDSVVNQTLSDIEIICVNDCSTDNSLSILQEYAQKDNRIKIIDLPQNGGLGHARNVVSDISTGDYIMYVDSDDWLEPDACEVAYNQINKNKNDFVYFNYNIYFDDTKEIKYNERRFESLASQPNLSDINPATVDKFFFSPVTAWSKIYSREFLLINKMKFYEERKTYEDKFFYTRALNCAKSISFINKPLYNYRKREGSITRELINNIDYLYASDKVFDYLLESHARKNLVKSYLINYMNQSLKRMNSVIEGNRTLLSDFYRVYHKNLTKIHDKCDIKSIKKYIDYSDIMDVICSDNYKKYKRRRTLARLCSLRRQKEHSVLCLAGVKMKFNTSK